MRAGLPSLPRHSVPPANKRCFHGCTKGGASRNWGGSISAGAIVGVSPWCSQLWVLLPAILPYVRGTESYHYLRPLGNKSDEKIRPFFFFFNNLCHVSILMASSFLRFCYHMESNKMKQWGRFCVWQVCFRVCLLSLSSPTTLGSALCHMARPATNINKATLKPVLVTAETWNLCLIHVLNAYIRSNTVRPFGLAFDLAVWTLIYSLE